MKTKLSILSKVKIAIYSIVLTACGYLIVENSLIYNLQNSSDFYKLIVFILQAPVNVLFLILGVFLSFGSQLLLFFVSPLLTATFWVFVFTFFTKIPSPLGARRFIKPILELAFVLLLSVPILFALYSDDLVDDCLAGELAYRPNVGGYTKYLAGTPDECFVRNILEDDKLRKVEEGTATISDVIDFCVTLSSEKKVYIDANDFNVEYLPKDTSFQEYCIFKLGRQFTNFSSNGGHPMAALFQATYLPDIAIPPQSVYEGGYGATMDLRKIFDEKFCSIYESKVQSLQAKDRCLKFFSDITENYKMSDN